MEEITPERPLELPLPEALWQAGGDALLEPLRAFLVPWERVYVFPMGIQDAPGGSAVAELAVARAGRFVRIGRAAARVLNLAYDDSLGGAVAPGPPRTAAPEGSAPDDTSFGKALVFRLADRLFDDRYDPRGERYLTRRCLPRQALFGTVS